MSIIPTVQRLRLQKTIQASARIGATSNNGLHRLALSDQDKEMRDLFVRWLNEEGLEVRIDDFGNIYGRRNGSNKYLDPIVFGSHLDTQPNGGRFDGIIGVLCALEVIRTFNDYAIETERPVEIVNFTNEEGARFEPSMLGSGGVTGFYDADYILSRTDMHGKTIAEELRRIGYDGTPENRLNRVHRFIELHVEQGQKLESSGHSIGAVEGVKGISCLEVKVRGEQNHAGSTPMSIRKDALLSAAKMHVEIDRLIRDINEEATATVGRISAKPNVSNCISGEVTFTIDIRHYKDKVRHNAVEMIKERFGTIAVAEGVGIEVEKLWDSPSTVFDKNTVSLIMEGAQHFNYPVRTIISGAGHDAQHMNRIVPSAMIFLPSINGKSHCEEEYTSMDDIEKGANTLLYVIYKLAQNLQLLDG